MPPEFTPRPLGRRDIAAQMAAQLRSAISTGVWLPGARLPTEQELAELFAVSRATARESVKLLAATGMVSSTRGSGGGTYVTEPDATEVAGHLGDSIQLWYRAGNVSVQDVDEARWILEMHCVDLAARRRDEADLLAIARPVTASRDASLDMAAWLDLDLEFHSAITRAARNRILELAMTSVHLARPATNTVFVDLLDRAVVSDQHEAIYRGIEAADPEAAQAALQAHVDYLDATRRQALADTDAATVLVARLPRSVPGSASPTTAEN